MNSEIEDFVANLIMNSPLPLPGTSVIVNSSSKVIDNNNVVPTTTTQEESELESSNSPPSLNQAASNEDVDTEESETVVVASTSLLPHLEEPEEEEQVQVSNRSVPNESAISSININDNLSSNHRTEDNEDRGSNSNSSSNSSSSSSSSNVVIEEEQIAIDTDTDDDVILVDQPVETIELGDDEEEEDVQIIHSNQPIPKPLPAKTTNRRQVMHAAKSQTTTSTSTATSTVPPTPRLPEPSSSSFNFANDETDNVLEITLLHDLLDNHFGNIDFDIPILETPALSSNSSACQAGLGIHASGHSSSTNGGHSASSSSSFSGGLFTSTITTEIAIQTEEFKPAVNDTQTQTTESSFASKRKWEYNDDDGDGTQCPICYEPWEESGEHSLVSLKCGHLFGDSCVKRWFNDQAQFSNRRFCPVCRTKAESKHIRPLYARRVVQIKYERLHEIKAELNRQYERAKKYETLFKHEQAKNAMQQSGLLCGPSTSSAITTRVVPVHQFGAPTIVATNPPAQLTSVRTQQIQVPTTSRGLTVSQPPLAHRVNHPPLPTFTAPTLTRDTIQRFIHFNHPAEFTVHDYSQALPDIQRNINH